MNENLKFDINFNTQGSNNLNVIFLALFKDIQLLQTEFIKVTQTINHFSESTTKAIEGVSQSVREGTKLSRVNLETLLGFVDRGATTLQNLATSGLGLNQKLSELSAITGVTGQGLKEIETAARQTAKTFGTNASDNIESYKMILSQLSPEIAKNSQAMQRMGENVNILSKQMGGNTIAATEVLTTSLNQFGVSMDDPIEAAKIMGEMMNVMSAAAQQGSAELPQIQQALQQVGMVAKTTGLSFAETNAYIQLLDQAGKKGSEGGVALRNVLTTLSEGRFTSKLAADGLRQAGISVDYLADTSVPLSQRLKSLRKIQHDTALMTKVFGKENMAAAIAMINTADQAQEMAQSIEGTSSAMEQANIIMENSAEKNARLKAQVEDFKISLFNLTGGAIGYASAVANMVQEMSGLYPIAKGLGKMLSFLTSKKKLLGLWSGILTAKTKVFSAVTKVATAVQWGWNAAMTANPIGIVIVAIGALVAAGAWLVSKVGGWGDFWKHTWNGAKLLFKGFIAHIKLGWNGMISLLMIGLNKIKEGWYVFKNAVGLGDKQENNRMLEQIRQDTEQRKKAIVEGAKEVIEIGKQTREEFAKAMGSLHWKKEKETPQEQEANPTKEKFSLANVSAKTASTPNIGGKTARQVLQQTAPTEGKTHRSQTLNIQTLIGNITIQTQSIQEGKQQIVERVKEAVLTAMADFTTA